MCGIAGYVTQAGEDTVRRVVSRLNAAMVHRGPDDGGVEVICVGDRHVGLGARRLAIQDLSPAGHQPMHDPETGNWLVLNGEIYNFHELRSRLASAGQAFQSGSDTEVILRAYAEWGLETTLDRLRGMFAFALWDADRRQLVIARDRLGVKPLYYAETPAGFVFASEVRALLGTGLPHRRLSPEGLAGYLSLGAVQEPSTLVDGMRSLPAGSFGTVSSGILTIKPYWSLIDRYRAQRRPASRTVAVGEVGEHLRQAVQLRLISDAPLGVFLSGGLDSTSVVALAATAGAKELRTVSVVFPEEEFSEEPYIRQVARRFDTVHTQIELSGEDLLAMLPRALDAMDQPTVDGINTFVVAGQARAAGLTVALSGLGGDELFGGYPSFRRVTLLQKLAHHVPVPVGRGAARAAVAVRDDDQVRKLARWLARRDLDGGPHILARELFGPADRVRLAGRRALVVTTFPDPDGLDDFNGVSYFETAHYLRNVLLRDTDVMGMAHSLEIREPLLDHRLLEYVASLPGELKAVGAGPKPLLVDALNLDLLDRVVRRKKMGFTLPFARWLRGPLHRPVQAALLDPRFGGQVAEALDAKAVAAIWSRFQQGRGTWVRPWALYTLKCWGERHLP